MGRIRVSTVIEASPEVVWEHVRDVTDHASWMADATAVRITGSITEGIGTVFEADTKVGPIKLTDEMRITEWVEGRVMGVVHDGVVTGTGRFELADVPGGATEFAWDETLVFPWWLGGRIGGVVGDLVLRLIWRRNLAALKAEIEASSDQSAAR